MVLCIIAFVVFTIMSIFSAKYRPLAKESMKCVFSMVTLRPCETGLDERIKAELVSTTLKFSPGLAKLVNKQFIIISWIFVLLTVGSFVYSAYSLYNFYYFGNCDGPTSQNACVLNSLTGDYGRFSDPKELVPPTDYVTGLTYGNPNSSIKIVEFGCFTCAYTKKAESTVKGLISTYGNSIYYIFKPFPLPNHNYSKEAAISVICASKQGKESKMRDLVFSQQEVCSITGSMDIPKLASDAGLNMTEFNNCFNSTEVKAELDAYIQEGKDAHIYATPTFFINGKPFVGPKTLEQFKCEINDKGIVEQIGCVFGTWWGK